ncbi:hypothetical protein [Croceitalea vernalis]|uniref:DUF3575 domain-containing protein n=1 Tax=Croceitalea vernalis TaxID=3075599 RepID=A0ABU3BJF4_9FLAO|nr:hypothetical protein [Croceitalea sp. P007]MDT0622298.1 hypothetical protein [Croceitalea sp. P007]
MRIISTFLCHFLTSIVLSQSSYNVENNQFKVNFLAPSLEYEKGIGNDATINLELGTGFAIRTGSERSTEFGIYPYVESQYRYYTNMKRRLTKGKKISANSGNYLALSVLYVNGNSILGDLNLSNNSNLFVGPLYGLQRTSKSGFNFGLEFGSGYYQNDVDSGLAVRIDFSIGWVLGNKKK